MRAPRILLVEDDRQVRRMLRTCLELSGRECVIMDTPSAEEALLEVTHGLVDLVVTDLVLPGMSGLELVARVRQSNPEARAILITGHPSAASRAEAESLGVVAYLPKPIRTNFFLEAVERALALSRASEPPVKVHEAGKAAMAEGLMAVLSELGAVAAYLIDQKARLVVQAGALGEVDLKSALPEMAVGLRATLRVSDQLGALLPANFLYFDGDDNTVFLTNVGSYFGLAIVFAGKLDAARLERVVDVSRRAADGILSALSKMAERGTGRLRAPVPEAPHKQPQPAETEAAPTPRAPAPRPPAAAPSIPDRVLADNLEAAGERIDRKQADRFWEQAAAGEDESPGEEGVIPFDEAKRRGLISGPAEE